MFTKSVDIVKILRKRGLLDASPPPILLTRLILPLGLPLLTLGLTNVGVDYFNRVARHTMFFGAAGAAMGISIEKSQSRSSAVLRASEQERVTSQLRLLIAAGGVEDDSAKAALSQVIDDLENSRYLSER